MHDLNDLEKSIKGYGYHQSPADYTMLLTDDDLEELVTFLC